MSGGFIMRDVKPYSTSFPLTQNPIRENGRWLNGLADGLDWSDCASSPGKGTGQQLAGHATDGVACLTGAWTTNQRARGVVFCSNQSDACFEEVELRLNTRIAAHLITGYEVSWKVTDIPANGYLIIVRWNGAQGSYDYLGAAGSSTWTGATYSVSASDELKADRVGNFINAYKNGVLQASVDVTDLSLIGGVVFTGGAPGFGANLENSVGGCSGRNADYGFSFFEGSEL